MAHYDAVKKGEETISSSYKTTGRAPQHRLKFIDRNTDNMYKLPCKSCDGENI
jgi:hypothetical protein